MILMRTYQSRTPGDDRCPHSRVLPCKSHCFRDNLGNVDRIPEVIAGTGCRLSAFGPPKDNRRFGSEAGLPAHPATTNASS